MIFSKPHQAKSARNGLVLLMLFLMLCGCSKKQSPWEGIWQTKVQTIPGQNLEVAREFSVKQNPSNDSWSGNWETIEFMFHGKFADVQISDSTIVLDYGGGTIFKGTLSQGGQTIRGTTYLPNGETQSMVFIKVDEWTSKMPARRDERGRALKSWTYTPPETVDDGWTVVSMENELTAAQPLNGLFKKVLSGDYQGLDAVLVAQNGNLVLEEYFHLGARDRLHILQSTTKSVTSILTGIALDQNLITDLNSPLGDFFPNYRDTIQSEAFEISLKHALMMAGGLDWHEWDRPLGPENDVVAILGSDDMYHYVFSKEMQKGVSPGERFQYNSGLSVLLGGVIRNVAKTSIDQFAEQTLFNQLGIKDYFWQPVAGQVHTGGGLVLKPRDVLKIGQLVLDKGQWNGNRVVSESWIKESTKIHLPILESKGEWFYGYQWWLGSLKIDQKMRKTIVARGHGGQNLWIIPDLGLVILTLHHNKGGSSLKGRIDKTEIEKYIIPGFVH